MEDEGCIYSRLVFANKIYQTTLPYALSVLSGVGKGEVLPPEGALTSAEFCDQAAQSRTLAVSIRDICARRPLEFVSSYSDDPCLVPGTAP